MAEQEIIDHTKKVYKAWKNPHTSVWHKFREIGLEIFIIVLAVSLSIWLHNWNEKRHAQKEATEFLEGLKVDLAADTTQMLGDLKAYENVHEAYQYFLSGTDGKILSNDSVREYSWTLYNNTRFNPNSSRFEALRGSGKLGIIENKALLGAILNYYQSSVPYVNMQNDAYTEAKKNITAALQKNAIYDNRAEYEYDKMFRNPEIRNILKRLSAKPKEMADTYRRKIKAAGQLISDIEKELK
jgi:Family of unknown function (DUF6090)